MQEDKLIASDGLSGDFFGKSVSLSGNRALIGADARDGSVANEGAAYVFEFDGTDWIETAKLTANDGEMNDLFGFSMSLLGDRAVIGAYASNDNGNNSGSIYVFDFDGIDWLLSDKLTPSDGALGDFFGYSLSLSQNRILVGSTFDDDNGGASGSAYVFDYDGNDWNETAKITASDGAILDNFGHSVSLFGDRAVISAYADDDNGTDSGSAYVFDYDGSDWNETTKLIPNNGTIEAFFGNSVSLSGDRVLIGTFVDNDKLFNNGSAYVFDFDGSSWSQSAVLTANNGTMDDKFGFSVSLFGDRALIGDYGDDGSITDSGAAYVFDFDGQSWNQSDIFKASDAAIFDEFGYSVSLNGDKALISSIKDDDTGNNSGSAYVFIVNEIIFKNDFEPPVN